jgi:hypothetical protein
MTRMVAENRGVYGATTMMGKSTGMMIEVRGKEFFSAKRRREDEVVGGGEKDRGRRDGDGGTGGLIVESVGYACSALVK